MIKLHIEGIEKAFAEQKVLKGASTVLEQGKITALIGRNGAGKTTLFNIIYRDLLQEKGEIFIEIDGQKRPLEAKDVGFLFSQPLVPDFMTGEECIKFYLDVHNLPSSKQDLDEAFSLVSMDLADRNKLIRDYSHGMKNKIMMLMVFLAKPPVILLDEPLTSLDIVLAREIKEFLRIYKEEHVIILSTHILELAKSLCDEIILLRNGKIEELSDAQFKDPNFEEILVNLLLDEGETEPALEEKSIESLQAELQDRPKFEPSKTQDKPKFAQAELQDKANLKHEEMQSAENTNVEGTGENNV